MEFISFIQWLMLGLKIFRRKLAVIAPVRVKKREIIHFKHNHYLYVTKHFEDTTIELWAHYTKRDGGTDRKNIYLGMYQGNDLNDLKQAPDFYTLPYGMERDTLRLERSLKDQTRQEKIEQALKEQRGPKKNIVYDREYFVRQGMTGQIIGSRNNNVKNTVELRHRKKEEFSTDKLEH